MTKSHHGKIYIDDADWGPEADSIEYGYRVPFGGIHIFIGKIGRLPVNFRRVRSSFDSPTVNRVNRLKPSLFWPSTPFTTAPKPILTPSMLSVVGSGLRGQKPFLIWTLLAP